jgi:hypothetical protein
MSDEEAECGERSSSRKRGGCGRLNDGLALNVDFNVHVSRTELDAAVQTNNAYIIQIRRDATLWLP